MKWWQISYLFVCFLIAGAALGGIPWLHQTGRNVAAFAFAGMAICLVGLGSKLFLQWRRSDTRSERTHRP
jgi:hypothetical protein